MLVFSQNLKGYFGLRRSESKIAKLLDRRTAVENTKMRFSGFAMLLLGIVFLFAFLIFGIKSTLITGLISPLLLIVFGIIILNFLFLSSSQKEVVCMACDKNREEKQEVLCVQKAFAIMLSRLRQIPVSDSIGDIRATKLYELHAMCEAVCYSCIYGADEPVAHALVFVFHGSAKVGMIYTLPSSEEEHPFWIAGEVLDLKTIDKYS
jgi:hypothetical protein